MMRNVVLGRRNFLFAAAGMATLPLLGACSTSSTEITTEWSNFVDEVNSVLAAGCSSGLSFISTAESIAQVVASLYGPAATATVSTISGAVTAVAGAICAAAPPTTTPAGKALKEKLKGSSLSLPVAIGVTKQGVTVIGYQR